MAEPLKQVYPAPLSNPDNSAAKQADFCADLQELDRRHLRERAEDLIWLSAFAANNPRSCYHWQADAVYDECMRRAQPEIYDEAYAAVRRSEGLA